MSHSRKHDEWSSTATRYAAGFSGYSIVDGTESASAEEYYSGSALVTAHAELSLQLHQ